MEPISDALYSLLVRQGISAGRPASPIANKSAARVGARKSRRNKGRGAASDGALSQVAAAKPEGTAQEERSGVWLCWDNPHMTKATGRVVSRAALVICE